MTTATQTRRSTSAQVAPPLSHAVCERCWPNLMDPAARGLCGELNTPAGVTPNEHQCIWGPGGCGCIPCQVCLDLEKGTCPTCGITFTTSL